MLRKASRLLAVVLLCGVVQTGVSLRADEPVKTGEKRDTLLYVRTDPPGAKVFLNGKELGSSAGLFQVEPGIGSILIVLEGRKPGEKQVTIRANAVNRVELSLEPQTEAEGSRFIGHLPQGTVELVGVTNYPPTKQSQWWRPDGSPAPLGPFQHEPKQWSTPRQKSRAFLLRVQGLPARASRPAMTIEPSTGSWWGSTGVLGAHEEALSGYYMFSAEVGDSAVTASLRVGVSAGAWKPPFQGVEFQSIALQPGQKTAVKVISSADQPVRSSPSETTTQENGKALQRRPSVTKKVSFVIGPSSFTKGDKIEIHEVRSELGTLANGDTVTVKGTYTLASHYAATLALYITQDRSKATQGGSDPPGITRTALAGTMPFEFQRPITYDGHLHLGFYDNQSGGCFGTVYFGTDLQMKEISHWNVGSWMNQGRGGRAR